MEQDNNTSLSSGPYRFYQHEDSQYLGTSYAQPHLPYQVMLHTGHVLLNTHLHQINKIDTPLCPSCGLDSESMHHFLFNCQVWRAECWHMGKALGCKAKLLQHVLSSEKGVDKLLRFLGRMEQFKATYGPDITPLSNYVASTTDDNHQPQIAALAVLHLSLSFVCTRQDAPDPANTARCTPQDWVHIPSGSSHSPLMHKDSPGSPGT